MADYTTQARPYAKAVFEIAREEGNFDAWSGRLAFWAAVIENPEMAQRLEAPGLTAEERARLLVSVDDQGIDGNAKNFIHLLAENDRLELMPDISTIFDELHANEVGEVEATITTAYELSDDQCAQIAEALGKRLDRQVRLTQDVDKDLIGGAVIRAGDLVIDGSVRGRLEQMEQKVLN